IFGNKYRIDIFNHNLIFIFYNFITNRYLFSFTIFQKCFQPIPIIQRFHSLFYWVQ
ncbi:hypothetical protein KPNIH6_01681, partial [Klebsiella pneumoniae subsp. pneumoniae KPNIH6]